jgi:hypothetical protein
MHKSTLLGCLVVVVGCGVDQPLENPDARPRDIAASVMSPTTFARGQLVRLTTAAPVKDQPKASSGTVGTEPSGTTAHVIKPGIVDSLGDGTTYFLLGNLPTTWGGWVSETYLEAAGPAPSPPSGCCYAAPPPLGSASKNGTYSSPWSLQHALDASVVPQGNDLWLRGGVYTDLYTAYLSGTSTDRIVIRPVPYERVIFRTDVTGDSHAQLRVEGQWLEFWDLEFENTSTDRTVPRPQAVYNKNSHNAYVRLVIRDAGTGIYNQATAQDVDFSGCVVYNYGFQGAGDPEHGFYIKSNVGGVRLRDNIAYNGYGYGIHAFSDAPSEYVNGVTLQGNVIFNSSMLSANQDYSANILIGGFGLHNDTAIANMTYWPLTMTSSVTNMRVGYSPYLGSNVYVKSNLVAGGNPVIEIRDWDTATVKSNKFHTYSTGRVINFLDQSKNNYDWSSNTHYRDSTALAWYYNGWKRFMNWKSAVSPLAATDNAPSAVPPSNWVVQRILAVGEVPEGDYSIPWEANLIVYNWQNLPSVMVNPDPVFEPGEQCDPYEVWNAQSMAWPVLTGCWYGGMLTLPLVAVTPPRAVGGPQSPTTGTGFHVFLLRNR